MAFFLDLNPVLQGFLATLFTYFVTSLGAFMVFFCKKMNNKIIDILLAFAAGVMIAASFWSLLAPAINISLELGRSGIIETGLGFIFGGLFVMMAQLVKKSKTFLLASSVTLHNIPEGLAVGVAFGSAALGIEGASLIGAISLAIGIGIQNFPEGACVALPLRAEGMSRKKAFFIGQASGIVEPFAGILGVICAMQVKNILPFLLSFSAGAMVIVVAQELIPESFTRNKVIASIGLILGFVLMMVLDVTLG